MPSSPIEESCPEEIYPKISRELLKKQIDEFQQTIEDFLIFSEYTDDFDYYVSDYVLAEIFIRIDKRRVYYLYFHEGVVINERKRAALLAYWILKLRPIQVNDVRERNERSQSIINEYLACYVIEAMLLEIDSAFEKAKAGASQDGYSFLDRLLYSFRYQHHSIDSMMMIVEALTPEMYSLNNYPSENHLA